MDRDRTGLFGELAADRPVLIVLLITFGLTALAIIGASDAPPGSRANIFIADMLIAGLFLVAGPFLVVALAQQLNRLKLLLAAVIITAVAGAYGFGPIIIFHGVTISFNYIVVFGFLSITLLFAGPIFGASTRFTFIAIAGALLGTGAGMALVLREGGSAIGGGALAGIAFAIGSIAGISVIVDFAALFARGANARRAAAVAAQYSTSSGIYAILISAFALWLVPGALEAPGKATILIWLSSAGVALAVAPAIFSTVGALSLRQSNESVAVEENRRRQMFRRFWRPFRRALPPSASLAIIGIAAITVVAAAINMPSPFPVESLLFILCSAISAGLIYFSLRTALFVFLELIVGCVFVRWLWETGPASKLAPIDESAATLLAAVLFANIAASWRDARSPRLNARETTEAAMADVISLHGLGALAAIAAFWTAAQAGVWPGGAVAGAYLACIAIIGLAFAPAVMTALSHSTGRDMV